MIDVFDQILGDIDDRIKTAVIDDAADILKVFIGAMDDRSSAHGNTMQVDLGIIIHLID